MFLLSSLEPCRLIFENNLSMFPLITMFIRTQGKIFRRETVCFVIKNNMLRITHQMIIYDRQMLLEKRHSLISIFFHSSLQCSIVEKSRTNCLIAATTKNIGKCLELRTATEWTNTINNKWSNIDSRSLCIIWFSYLTQFMKFQSRLIIIYEWFEVIHSNVSGEQKCIVQYFILVKIATIIHMKKKTQTFNTDGKRKEVVKVREGENTRSWTFIVFDLHTNKIKIALSGSFWNHAFHFHHLWEMPAP